MTDIGNLPVPATTVVDVLCHEPGSVADALDVHMRLSALGAWVNDRKGHVAGWLKAKGEARLAEDGAAPTWRLTDGLVLLTDPQPSPVVEDREAFAAWYEQAGGTVGRLRTASVDADALLAFHDEFIRALGGDPDRIDEYVAARLVACGQLFEVITVTEDVLLPADVLDGLLSGDDLPNPNGNPRVALAPGPPPWLVDTTTGERVPGTTVRPAGPRQVQVRPDTKAKTRVRGELDRLLGPPAIGG